MKKRINKSELIRTALKAGEVPKDIAAKLKVPVQSVYTLRWKMNNTTKKPKRKLPMVIDRIETLTQEQANEVYQSLLKPKGKADDVQFGGDHYRELGVQPWRAMQAWMSNEAFAGFLRGNAIKYLARTEKKGGVEDLKKARHYLDKLIEVVEAA